MVKKKDNFILWIVGIILLLLVLSQFGIFKKKEDNVVGMKVHYWNNGVEVFPDKPKGLFSIVSNENTSGIFDSLSFDIKITNFGGFPTSNIHIADASPIEFKNALPSTVFNLSAGESRTLSSQNMSTAQFEHYPQPISFWVKMAGDEYNGTMIILSSLSIKVLEAAILIRVEKPNTSVLTDFLNSWIATDYNGDGKLEAFGSGDAHYGSSVNCALPGDAIFISSYGNWTVQKDVFDLTKISICKNQHASGSPVGSDGVNFYTYLPPVLNANLNILSVPAYVNREVYNYNQTHTCGNNIKESIEICDGTDLGGNTCNKINQGFASGNLACNSDCRSFNTNACVLGTSVTFRTTSLLYGVSNIAVAYSPTCGGNLVAYGKIGGACLTHFCDNTDQTLNVPSIIGTTKMWYVDANTLCICDENNLGAHSYSTKYSTTDTTDASKVSISKSLITPSKEIVC
jgi:hypothetical protein